MNRVEALKLATEWVDEHSKVERNDKGYVRDGWKPPTLSERTETVLRLADWLLQPESSRESAPSPPRAIPPTDPGDVPAPWIHRPPGFSG